MYGECRNNIHLLPRLCFSRSASYQSNQIELSLQTQPTTQLSSLKLISVFDFCLSKHLANCNEFLSISSPATMFLFYSCTCILHTLLDVVSKNYSAKQTRKEADDEKTNSENPESSHPPY